MLNLNNNKNNNNKDKKTKKQLYFKNIIKILISLTMFILLLWWFGFFEQTVYKDLKHFQNDIKDVQSAFKKIILDPDNKKIFVTLDENKITTLMLDSKREIFYKYVVIASSDTINNFHNYVQSEYKDIKDAFLNFPKIKNVSLVIYKIVNENTILYKLSLLGNFFISLIRFFVFALYLFFFIRFRKIDFMSYMDTKFKIKKINSKKKFKDIAGMEEAKQEVKEIVDFLKSPKKYELAGARIPKGVLLIGLPGTGKTLLAKAVAGESKVPFYFIAASNFVELFSGLGAKRVRTVFKKVRENAPAILFIDEIDAIGRKRSSFAGNDEKEQTLNQILIEMDGMEETNGLLVIAATNRRDILDSALQRPGRFDRIITVNLPDIKEREAILKLHAKGKRMSSDIDFKNIAKRTPQYSGAELENVINESVLLSIREKTNVITLLQIDEAIDRVLAGPSKKHRVITKEENRLVAIHEAGHAVLGLKLEHADIVQKITIIPRGEAGGYTLMTPKKELHYYSKLQLIAKITGLFGGKVSEEIFIGPEEISTGSSNDIQRATDIAKKMVTNYGMSELGPITYEKNSTLNILNSKKNPIENSYSKFLAKKIDEAVRALILEAEAKATKIIKKNKKLHKLITEELIEKETIILEEINYINKYLKRPNQKNDLNIKKQKTKSIKKLIEEVKNKNKSK